MSIIAAIATPDAPGGISVIRISGEEAIKKYAIDFLNRLMAERFLKWRDIPVHTAEFSTVKNILTTR